MEIAFGVDGKNSLLLATPIKIPAQADCLSFGESLYFKIFFSIFSENKFCTKLASLEKASQDNALV